MGWGRDSNPMIAFTERRINQLYEPHNISERLGLEPRIPFGTTD